MELKSIHARKFGYDAGVRLVSVHTDSEGRGKKLSRVEKEVSDICVAVPFDGKLNILGDNQRSCSSKDLD